MSATHEGGGQTWGRQTGAGVLLSIHVQPKAARTACVGLHGDAVKIRVAAPPVDGAANDELLRFLADSLALPRRAVVLQAGDTSRHKQVLLQGVTLAVVQERLGL